MQTFRFTFISGLIGGALLAGNALAADVITDWASVTAPPAPKLEAVTPDIKTTALLMLDFNSPPCDAEKRPRCVATIPAVKALLDKARAKGMFVVYTLGGATSTASIDQRIKPNETDPVFSSGPDKFLNTDLDKTLKEHGIKTVITVGTVSNGAVLYTASEAVFRGYDVIVPIDGCSAETPFGEQMTLWQLTSGPRLPGHVKLTRGEMIN